MSVLKVGRFPPAHPWFFLAVFAASISCASAAPAPAPVPAGRWGGQGAVLETFPDRVVVELGCLRIVSNAGIRPDADGRFRLAAVQERKGPGPVRDDQDSPPAQLEGRVQDGVIEGVVLVDGRKHPFRVSLGKNASVVECL